MIDNNITKLLSNTPLKSIIVTTLKVMCCGSAKPFDHPHIYLPLTKNGEVLCPYCNIKYIYKKV